MYVGSCWAVWPVVGSSLSGVSASDARNFTGSTSSTTRSLGVGKSTSNVSMCASKPHSWKRARIHSAFFCALGRSEVVREGREVPHGLARDGRIRQGAELPLDLFLRGDARREESARRRERRAARPASRRRERARARSADAASWSLLKGAASIIPLPLRRAPVRMKALKTGTGNLPAVPDASEGRLAFDLAPNAVTRRPARPAAMLLPACRA